MVCAGLFSINSHQAATPLGNPFFTCGLSGNEKIHREGGRIHADGGQKSTRGGEKIHGGWIYFPALPAGQKITSLLVFSHLFGHVLSNSVFTRGFSGRPPGHLGVGRGQIPPPPAPRAKPSHVVCRPYRDCDAAALLPSVSVLAFSWGCWQSSLGSRKLFTFDVQRGRAFRRGVVLLPHSTSVLP